MYLDRYLSIHPSIAAALTKQARARYFYTCIHPSIFLSMAAALSNRCRRTQHAGPPRRSRPARRARRPRFLYTYIYIHPSVRSSICCRYMYVRLTGWTIAVDGMDCSIVRAVDGMD